MSVRRAVPFLVTTAVAAVAVTRAPTPDLAHVSLTWLAVAVAAFFVGNNLVCGLRWWLLLPTGWTPVAAVRRYSEGVFAGLAIPFGSDLLRSVATRDATSATVADRLISGAVIATAAYAAGALGGGGGFGLPPAFVRATPVLALGFAGAAVAVLRRRGGTTPPARLIMMACLSLVYVLLVAVVLWATARAAGVALQPTTVALGAPIMLLGAALPSVGGLSPGVAAAGWLVVEAGGSGGVGSTTAGLLVLELWLVALVGGASLLAGRHRAANHLLAPGALAKDAEAYA